MAQLTRKIKVVKLDLKRKLADAEERVNEEVDKLVEQGCKIVSITHYVVPAATFYIIYNIVYETTVDSTTKTEKKAVDK